MKKRIWFWHLFLSAILCFLIVLCSCESRDLKNPEDELLLEKSESPSKVLNATFRSELDLYQELHVKNGQQLRLLDATSERILYEISERRLSKSQPAEGILSHTCKAGVYLWKEESIAFETTFQKDLYISSGSILDDKIFLVGIDLDENENHYRILECDSNSTTLKMEGITIPYFTYWPVLYPLYDKDSVLLWVPYEDEEQKGQVKIYLISQNETKEIYPPFRGELLSGNDLLADKDSFLTFWEIDNNGEFIRWNLDNSTQMCHLPEGKRILDYVPIKDGILASLQTDDIQSVLCFLPFENSSIKTISSIPLFRMTTRTDQSVFCVDGNFQLYEILLLEDGITLTPVNLSPWLDSSGSDTVSILCTEDGTSFINIENENTGKILIFR